ncbi:MAG: DNA polymerase [Candidatus Omnitrophica bacterium]|nr:DNA polymerase [Candidatus Omnitrophota bacterium]
MEARGLNVDIPKLKAMIDDTSKEKSVIEAELREVLGVRGPINFNSSKDIAHILSSTLGVEPKVTRTGRYSTCRRILKAVNNPLTDKISHYRDLTKLLSVLTAIYDATDKAKGKIFCTYTDDCPSGRLYTQNYSFQNIPQEARTVIDPDEGCAFILADYDSFELRILSALSHDEYFKSCWTQGLDLHRKVVSDMKAKPYETVTDKERKLGKALNFGLSYGQEPMGLARNLHISVEKAQELMDNYKSKIPMIEAFKTATINRARETGFAETYYGRHRFLSNIKSPRTYDRKKSERQAVNTRIQGTAADVVKFSLVTLYREGFAIDTMVHDSILITVPEEILEQSVNRVKEIMEIELENTKLPVSCKVGKTWGDCH